jgi:hypothetical protein
MESITSSLSSSTSSSLSSSSSFSFTSPSVSEWKPLMEAMQVLTEKGIQPHRLLNGEINENDLKSIGIELGVVQQLVKFFEKDTTPEERHIERQEKKEKKKKVNVFLSFTGEEKKWGEGWFRKTILRTLALSLENEGLLVFFDERIIKKMGKEKCGEEATFGEIIRNGIWDCCGGGLFVMLMTDNYLDTKWPLMEMGMAYLWREKGIRLLPILLTENMTMEFCKKHRHIRTLTPKLTEHQFETNIKLADDDAGERQQEQRPSEDEGRMRAKRIEDVVEKLKMRILEDAKTRGEWGEYAGRELKEKDELNVRDMESAVQVHTFDFVLVFF